MHSIVSPRFLSGLNQEHLQALERALEDTAKEEGALHKRAAAVQKAVEEVARLAPGADSAAWQMSDDGTNKQVGLFAGFLAYWEWWSCIVTPF